MTRIISECDTFASTNVVFVDNIKSYRAVVHVVTKRSKLELRQLCFDKRRVRQAVQNPPD